MNFKFKTIPKIIIALFAVYAPCSMANEFEYTVDASARSYSAGLSVVPTVAYKFALWGADSDPLQGALRPKLIADLSPATYSGKAELEFAPVTFFSLSVGRKLMRRFSTFDEDICRNYNCVGSMNSTDATAKLLFKFGPIMGSLKYTKAFFDSKNDKSQALVDPSTYVLINPTNEIANQIEAIVGTEINDSWMTGVLIQNVKLEKNHGNQNGQYLVALKKNGHTNYIAGLGRFESQLKVAKPSFIFTFNYNWQ